MLDGKGRRSGGFRQGYKTGASHSRHSDLLASCSCALPLANLVVVGKHSCRDGDAPVRVFKYYGESL
jgi:hypothetical protein